MCRIILKKKKNIKLIEKSMLALYHLELTIKLIKYDRIYKYVLQLLAILLGT